LLGRKLLTKPEISTFHSLCVRVLRRQIYRLGYPRQFAIYDRSDQESLARAALRELKVPGAELRPGDLLYHIGRWKNASRPPHEAERHARTDREHLAAMGYRRYQQAIKNAGAVDFDDLLLLTEQLFREFDDARQAEASRFDHILVDEYQDTNGSQYRIIKALAAQHRNLCVVGDDDQSIYGWRGAEVTHILRFRDDWPDANVVRLEENYRSCAPILHMANLLIRHNRQRHDKQLRPSRLEGDNPRIVPYQDEGTEAREVVGEIARLIFKEGVQPRDIAILFRTNEQPRPFEAELRKARLPYTLVGGMSFYDRKEVRDVLAWLRLLVQPNDEVSLLRVINTPPRGIGPKAVEAVIAHAVAAGKPAWEILPQVASIAGLPPAAKQGIGKLRALVAEYSERARREPLVDVVVALLSTLGYQAEINRLYPDPAEQLARWNSVEELINSLGDYSKRSKQPTLDGFLDDVALSSRDDENDKESKLAKNAIVLMTLHAAKGLEYPHVYMVGLEEGLLPHHRAVKEDGKAIDEERRLCYVGVTRARDRLTLTMSLNRFKWGKLRPTLPSRFLFELQGRADSPQARKALEESRHGVRRVPQAAASTKVARSSAVAQTPRGGRTTGGPAGRKGAN
jgi:DNA helicase-2/ATP-dependent DNA helicase PcrA